MKVYLFRYLWHGTKPENLISILKCGLLATPPNAIQCGQLFGEVEISKIGPKSEIFRSKMKSLGQK